MELCFLAQDRGSCHGPVPLHPDESGRGSEQKYSFVRFSFSYEERSQPALLLAYLAVVGPGHKDIVALERYIFLNLPFFGAR